MESDHVLILSSEHETGIHFSGSCFWSSLVVTVPAVMPVMVMPAVVPMPVVVMPVMAPADLFGLEAVDLVAGHDGGLDGNGRHKRTRRQRRGLRACGEHGYSHGQSSGQCQQMATFHDFSPPGTMR
jgi:hypothetical protein